MTDQTKRVISFACFGAGVFLGLLGCLRAPAAIFVIGDNDSKAEIWTWGFYLATFVPTCLLALRRRKIASIWLLCLAIILTWGLFAERHYLEAVRHFPKDRMTHFLMNDMFQVYVLAAIGIFGLWTEQAGWPRIIGNKSADEVDSIT